MDSSTGQNQLSAWLGALVAFTATTTWKVFQKPNFASLAAGMEKLCQTFLSHLVTSASMMQTMKSVLLRGTSGSIVNLKKTAITAIITIVTRPTLTEKHLNSLILYTFSIPGLTFHTGQELARNLLIKNGIFKQKYEKTYFQPNNEKWLRENVYSVSDVL